MACDTFVDAHVMDDQTIRMRQRGYGLGFTFETGERLRVSGEMFGQYFDCGVPVEPGSRAR
jgi:hypothetical protein